MMMVRMGKTMKKRFSPTTFKEEEVAISIDVYAFLFELLQVSVVRRVEFIMLSGYPFWGRVCYKWLEYM